MSGLEGATAARTLSKADSGRVWRTAFASFAAYNIAALTAWIQPAVVSEYISVRGFPADQAGLLASIEMVLIAFVMFGWNKYGFSTNYRLLGMVGAGIVAAAAACSIVVTDFWILALVRATAAIGFGLLMLVPSMTIAALPSPQAMYARMYAISLLCSAGVLAALPAAAALFGRPPAFPTYILYAAILFPVLLLMPTGSGMASGAVSASTDGDATRAAARGIRLLGCGIAALAIAYSAVWPFYMLLAGNAGLTSAQATTAASICLIFALAGSILSSPLSGKIGRLPTIIMACVMVGAGLASMVLLGDRIAFLAGGFVALLGLYLMVPAVLGMAAAMDRSGRGAAFINAAILLAAAVGPYAGGLIIKLAGVEAIGAVAIASMIVAVAIFLLCRTEEAAAAR